MANHLFRHVTQMQVASCVTSFTMIIFFMESCNAILGILIYNTLTQFQLVTDKLNISDINDQ